jgi:hypothetical protein
MMKANSVGSGRNLRCSDLSFRTSLSRRGPFASEMTLLGHVTSCGQSPLTDSPSSGLQCPGCKYRAKCGKQRSKIGRRPPFSDAIRGWPPECDYSTA